MRAAVREVGVFTRLGEAAVAALWERGKGVRRQDYGMLKRRGTAYSTLFMGLFLGCCSICSAQELEISVSPTPVGSGARAAGMGYAFVAIADDATAASWNPAGLVQLERPEISLAYMWNAVYDEFSASGHPEVNSRHNDQNLDVNYLSVVYPLPVLVLGRNVSVALKYQRKYDLSRSFSLDYSTAMASRSGTVTSSVLRLDFEQEGGLSTLTPAVAMELTHRLSVGAAFNFWESSFLNDNGWSQTSVTHGFSLTRGVPFLLSSRVKESYEDFSGFNMTLGGLWNFAEKWRIGVRYDTAFTGSADYRREGATIRMGLAAPGSPFALRIIPQQLREKRYVRFPDSLALGLAWQRDDRLTLSFDVTRTDWNDFYVKLGSGARRSLVDFSTLDNRWRRPRFQPTYTVRLGAEYVFIPREPREEMNRLWTLRGGLFLDEEPATGRTTRFSVPADRGSGKADQFYGFSLGAGLLLNNRVNLDAAYVLRYGSGVNKDFIRGVRGFEEDVVQHQVMLSTVIYF